MPDVFVWQIRSALSHRVDFGEFPFAGDALMLSCCRSRKSNTCQKIHSRCYSAPSLLRRRIISARKKLGHGLRSVGLECPLAVLYIMSMIKHCIWVKMFLYWTGDASCITSRNTLFEVSRFNLCRTSSFLSSYHKMGLVGNDDFVSKLKSIQLSAPEQYGRTLVAVRVKASTAE